jgi:hypothetical protein
MDERGVVENKKSHSWNWAFLSEPSPQLNTIWILSVLAIVGAAAYFLLPATGEALESDAYIFVGLSIGALFFVQLLDLFKITINSRTLTGIRTSISLLALGGIIFFAIKQFSPGAALGSVCIWAVIAHRFQLNRQAAIVFFAFLFIIWQFFVKLQWGIPFDTRLFSEPQTFICFVAALFLSAWWIRSSDKKEIAPRWLEWLVGGMFFVFCVFAATRQNMDFHHWSFYLGPIQLLKEGHWLLWDIPSQYGFLNVLLASLMPFDSPLTSFYILLASSLVISAILSYRLFCSKNRNLSNLVFASLIIFMVTFLLTGGIYQLLGPTVFPSMGAFRFIWCFVLISICARIFELKNENRNINTNLILGTIAWTIALYWSIESGVYASCIWIPFFVIMRWETRSQTRANYFHRAQFVLLDLIVATLLPLAFAVAIWIFYKLRLGHAPDWYAYIEYALAYKNGRSGQLIDFHGAIWVLLLILSVLSALAMFAIKRKSLSEFAVAVSLIGLVWGTGTYFILRSLDLVMSTLLPLVIIALSAALLITMKFREDESGPPFWRLTLQSILSGIFVVGTTATLGNPVGFKNFATQIFAPRNFATLHEQIPALRGELLAAEGLSPEDSIVYFGKHTLPAWSDEKFFYKLWLPIAPAFQFSILSDERQKEYLHRFLEMKAAPSGWIVANNLTDYNLSLIATEVSKTYVISEHRELLDQKLYLFKYVKKEEALNSNELAR